jgi:hypothetical protein
MAAKIAVAGAGIYGATAAIRLAEHGHRVTLFDPLGIMRAASAINQFRVHAGYHYPRSPETIAEIKEASGEFLKAFAPAIVRNSRHYYAIPRGGSRTPAGEYEKLMAQHGLALQPSRPDWVNFEFIEGCYQVAEHLYDPHILRSLIESRVKSLGIGFEQRAFSQEMRAGYDFVVWAAYGLGSSRALFNTAKVQVAEKILIELPEALRGLAVVIVDGPFTAFDPYGNSALSLFGSAKHTNHWSTSDPDEPVPERYAAILNSPTFEPAPFTRFHEMRVDCCLAIPAAKAARYLGSRFTLRVVENSPEEDRRTLYIVKGERREFHIFSGKVVSAVKAARLICEAIDNEG